jgi:hypothetical protein
MTRTRRTVDISDTLWDALGLMSREMSVDRDALLNQALFTFARLNGYVTPGAVAPHARPQPESTAVTVPPVAQPLASPPGAGRRSHEAAPPPSEAQSPFHEPGPQDGAPRTATGSFAAVTAAGHTSAKLSDQSPPPTTLPDAKARPATSPAADSESISAPAPTPPSANDAEPIEDEAGQAEIDALPGSGSVEWKVPRQFLADPAGSMLKGTVKSRHFQGSVQLFDSERNLLQRVDLGGPIDDARMDSVLVDETREPNAWEHLSQEFERENHIGEAMLAVARAVGAGAQPQTLTAWLAKHTIALTERAARERARKASQALAKMNLGGALAPRKAAYLVNELLQGAFPATILCELAIDQHQYARSRAAADLIRSAKALDPSNKPLYAFTQARIEMDLGRPEAARACVAELRGHNNEQANSLTTSLNGLFPEWGFWPALDPIIGLKLDVETVPLVRKLAEFRNAIQKTALRFKSLQERLEKGAPADSRWLPPSVDGLLARGKVRLSKDETLELTELQDSSILEALRLMHTEWARLTWLCWLAGLDSVSLPSATSKPRSPSGVSRALELRQRVFALRVEGARLDEAFEAGELDDALAVARLAWLGTTVGEVDAGNAIELGLPEGEALLAAVSWATNAQLESPFGTTPKEESHDSEPDEERAPVTALEADHEDHAAEIGFEDAPPAERTNIVRPSGRKIWVQREGHDTLELSGLRLSVGRDPRCEIVIVSPRVSREHAAIHMSDDTVLITDLNSSNGTFFNGVRITKHTVNDGDVVQFGNEKVTFRFSSPD